MSALMYRLTGNEYKKASGMGGGYFNVGGALMQQSCEKGGYYFLSEVGRGTQPLVLVGEWHEIGIFCHMQKGIKNVRCHVTESGEKQKVDGIYLSAGVCTSYKVSGLFPLVDSVKALVNSVAGVAGAGFTGATGAGNTFAEVALDFGVATSDAAGQSSIRGISQMKKKKQPTIFVKFSGLPLKNSVLLGDGEILFKDHLSTILRAIEPHVLS